MNKLKKIIENKLFDLENSVFIIYIGCIFVTFCIGTFSISLAVLSKNIFINIFGMLLEAIDVIAGTIFISRAFARAKSSIDRNIEFMELSGRGVENEKKET